MLQTSSVEDGGTRTPIPWEGYLTPGIAPRSSPKQQMRIVRGLGESPSPISPHKQCFCRKHEDTHPLGNVFCPPALPTGRIVFSVALFISLDLQIWFEEQISVPGLCAVEMFLAVGIVFVRSVQGKKGMKSPMPCRGCGIGVQADYRFC